ncbi:ComEC/Rec2 family competence protein [Oricola sp.]|uniref:ComEC/Rec2 family competence protein n=1 Tax=Oricola sp. TaxID=1979950 RepID=UPI003BAD41C4
MSREPGDAPETVVDERVFFNPEIATPKTDRSGQQDGDADRKWQTRPAATRARVRFRRIWHAALRTLSAAFARERAVGTAFLFVPVALCAGVVWYFQMSDEPAAYGLVLWLAVPAAFLALVRDSARIARAIAAALALVVAGTLLAQWHASMSPQQMLGSAVTTRLTGRIAAIEERANGRTRLTVDILATERPKLRYAPDRVRLTASRLPQGLQIGGGIKGVARLMPISGPFHPGGYDFTIHAYFDGYGANGFFLGEPSVVVLASGDGGSDRFALGIARLRQAIGAEIARVTDGRGGAVAVTLITGNKSVIPADVTEALRTSGLAHILSISGLHMALVAATVMTLLRTGFALAPNWSARRPVKKYAAAVALAATGFYLFLAGASVATQRSFIMLAIMLLALTFDRSAVTMRNLALAAIAVVMLAPHEVTGPGFQMSFAATAALIAVYAAWRDHRQGRRSANSHEQRGLAGQVARRVLLFVAGLAVTSLVAGLATGVFASYHFGRVAPYGLLANLAAMPLVSLLVMPLAVVSVMAMPFGMHAVPLQLMAWSVEQVIVIAERVAALSPPIATGQMPDLALFLFVLALVCTCLFSTVLRFLSLLPLTGAIVVWQLSVPPVAIVSEDARQFAVLERSAEGIRLHVNRKRPNAFTLNLWSGASGARTTVLPGASDVIQCDDMSCVASAGSAGTTRIGYLTDPGPQDNVHQAHKNWADRQGEACRTFDLVVVADAPSWQYCPNGRPLLSARQLALYGAAEIHVSGVGEIDIRHALAGPERPWLEHRRFSRAARNLAERRRNSRQ